MKKEIANLFMTLVYKNALEFARKNNQTTGEKHDFFITIEQLEKICLYTAEKVDEKKNVVE